MIDSHLFFVLDNIHYVIVEKNRNDIKYDIYRSKEKYKESDRTISCKQKELDDLYPELHKELLKTILQ